MASLTSPDSHGTIVKEGNLSKRGEYIKNWRSRWFTLYSDGTFYGYKSKPSEPVEPLNQFKIEGKSAPPIFS
jgi:RAC serine/threonine-protein kinase